MWSLRVKRADWWRKLRGAGARTCLIFGAVLAAAALPARVSVEKKMTIPRAAPFALAHVLADFSFLARVEPAAVSWSVEDETSNHSAWRYHVAFECGDRCTGRASVLAVDHRPAPGMAPTAHTVQVMRSACWRLPMMPWPAICDEWQTESVVTRVSDGAHLAVSARAQCSALRALTGACSRSLRRHLHHQALLLAEYNLNK